MSGAARFIVRGRVQGVAFRAHARAEAMRLGLGGHALNRGDGSVDVLAVGEDAAVEALAGWLAIGPPLARVERVERIDANGENAHGGGFRIG